MSNAKFRVKFPCGMEYEASIKTGIFDMISTADFDGDKVKCPLHGKDCPIKKEAKE